MASALTRHHAPIDDPPSIGFVRELRDLASVLAPITDREAAHRHDASADTLKRPILAAQDIGYAYDPPGVERDDVARPFLLLPGDDGLDGAKVDLPDGPRRLRGRSGWRMRRRIARRPAA